MVSGISPADRGALEEMSLGQPVDVEDQDDGQVGDADDVGLEVVDSSTGEDELQPAREDQ